MRGRHHNLFYYFRGPSKTAGSAQAQEESHHRQVEDNTTKALVNLLEHAQPELTASFLKWFVPRASLDGLDARAYHLQGGPKAPTENAWLLGLSVLGEIDPNAGEAPTDGGSRVDAAIHLPGGSLVLIEVKVVEYLDPHQLARHTEEWQLPVPPTDQMAWPDGPPGRLARWTGVHEWACAADAAVTEPVSRFLLDQFREYLQLVGLAPFAGFRDENFQWLALPAGQRSWDIQAEVKAHLRTMWEAIREGLRPDEAQKLGEIHANQLPLDATGAAAQTNWGEHDVNITIELTSDELQVNLVGWNAPQAKMFEAWLAPGGHIRCDAAVEDFELAVFRRRPHNHAQKGTGKKAWWLKVQLAPPDRQPLGELAGKPLAALVEGWRHDADPNWEKLSYHLRRAWPRATAVAEGPDLVPQLVETVRVLLPLLAQINHASTTASGMSKTALDRDRFRGALLGLAVGDAVGTTVEFKPPGTFEPVTDMVGGGPFGLPPGAWTDDTSMALCLTESLAERGRFDPIDQLKRYVRWYREGHLSSTGSCFDIGNATRAALERFERTGEPFPGDADPGAAGNGPLMKLAPVALAHARYPAEAVARAGDCARTTHGAPQAIDASRYFAGLLVNALHGATVSQLLQQGMVEPLPWMWGTDPLHPEVAAVAAGSFHTKEPPAIKGNGLHRQRPGGGPLGADQDPDLRGRRPRRGEPRRRRRHHGSDLRTARGRAVRS